MGAHGGIDVVVFPGELVGIVSAKDVSADVDNMGYAIPSNLTKLLAENIIDNCDGDKSISVKKALLGITITAYVSGLSIDPETGVKAEFHIVGFGSLAYGKVEVGDIINSITVNGVTRQVTKIHHVTDFMLAAREGHIVSLNLTRNGKTVILSFQITDDTIGAID